MSLSTMGAGGGARWFVGATEAIDFANGWSLSGTAPSSLITTTRASDAYASNAAGVWSVFSSNVPRITDLGLLKEESRTNSIRNNSGQGAVAGTPGTPPTNWGPSATGLTIELVGTGTENGVDYIDYRFSGTTGATFGQVLFDTTTAIAATNSQTWVGSAFLKLVSGSMANVTSLAISMSQRDAGGAAISSVTLVSGIQSTLSATLTRFSGSGATNSASTAYVQPLIGFQWSTTVAVDFTLRIGWPQLELATATAAVASSPIRTTSAAATRAADLVTLTTVPISGGTWTAFVDATSPTTAGKSTYFLAAGNNDLIVYSSTAAQTRVSAFNGAATLNATAGNGVWSTGIRAAVAADGSGRSAVGNNGTMATDANTQTFPAALAIGSRSVSTTEGIITTRRVALWQTRLTNAQLQAITA